MDITGVLRGVRNARMMEKFGPMSTNKIKPIRE
jgi:hypothetical protein